MSDYLPPGSKMHINQIPEECLRILFTQLPFETQFEAGDVCRLWRTVRGALFRIEKSLTIRLNDYYYNRVNKTCLIIIRLNEQCTASLVAMFPSLTELTIFISNRALFKDPHQVAHLLDQYRDQLDTLKLDSDCTSSWNDLDRGSIFFDVINSMPKLKKLSLGFYFARYQVLPPFDLPILRQLDHFDFTSPRMNASIITLWLPHLEARSTPMEISLDMDDSFVDHTLFDSITPKVASMFTKFPQLRCNLQQFQHLSTRFTNLTQLSLSDYDTPNPHYASDVPALMRALVNLKQLNTLSIEAKYVDHLNAQPGDDAHLLQLPTVKKWHLELRPTYVRICSHAQLSSWTANLSRLFPNLEDLTILLDCYAGCTDCDFYLYTGFIVDSAIKNAQVMNCLCRQLRLIKQHGSKLSKATMYYHVSYNNHTNSPYLKCTLEDIAN